MKKALRIAGRILTVLILLFAVFVMVFTIISVNTVNRDDASFFGFKPYIVLSDSMQQEFAVGDMIISRATDDTASFEEGDIITFRSIDPAHYGEVVTHKIRSVTTYQGEMAYVTYGTSTGADDAYPALARNIIGEYVLRLPKMGYFFQFLRSPAGYFTIILIPFLILIAIQAVKFFRLVRQYKAEQQMQLAEQKAALEAERLQAEKMKEELERLKRQLESKTQNNDASDVSSENGGEG